VKSDLETRRQRDVSTPEHYINTADKIKASKIAIRDDDGAAQYLLTVFDDITERRRSEQHISYLAHNDSLTGLPNRTSFLNLFETPMACRKRRASPPRAPISIVSEANDTYGTVGDALLREAARRLQTAAEGAFLARIGGDEFIVVLSGDKPEAAASIVGERMIEAFKENFDVDGHQIQVGLSVGVAVYPADGADATALIANADAALYQAKSEVRGSVRFFEECRPRLRERRELRQIAHAPSAYTPIALAAEDYRLWQGCRLRGAARWHRRTRCVARDLSRSPNSTQIIAPGEWICARPARRASWPNFRLR
jgi:diguanylate cyclase (GGDEF)-like protein